MSYSPKRAAGSGSSKQIDGKSTAKRPVSASDAKKQKGLVIAIVAVLVVIVVVALTFILAPSDGSFLGIPGAGVIPNQYVPETQSETTILTQYYHDGILPTSGSRHDIDVINGGGANASDLLGSWRLDKITVYMFDGAGRGMMLTDVDNYSFMYSAQDGKLDIDFDVDKGNDFEYDYSLDGDTLTITRNEQTFVLTKEAQ